MWDVRQGVGGGGVVSKMFTFKMVAIGGGQTQGMKLTFFSRGHLASKYLKVVANSKKLVASVLKCHLKKLILVCYFGELHPPEL